MSSIVEEIVHVTEKLSPVLIVPGAFAPKMTGTFNTLVFNPLFLCILASFHSVSVDYILGRTDLKTPYPAAQKKIIRMNHLRFPYGLFSFLNYS